MKNQPLSKVDVLMVLSEVKEASADDLAGLLAKAGFRDPKNDLDHARLEAGGWLRRLYRQGLVERREDQKDVQYLLPIKDKPAVAVERHQRITLWKITKKGLGRMEWLQGRDSPSKPPSRTGKTPKEGGKLSQAGKATKGGGR